MQTWIGVVLDWRTETKINVANKEAPEAKEFFDQTAIDAAHRGKIEPLRARYPHIAQFIHLPRKGRRGKYPRRSSGTIPPVEAAVEAATFVRLLWREVYGRRNRRRDDDMSAEAVVARYYKDIFDARYYKDTGFAEVTEDAIKKRARKYRIHPLVAAQDAELVRSVAVSIGR
jgi:hypothetical protein